MSSGQTNSGIENGDEIVPTAVHKVKPPLPKKKLLNSDPKEKEPSSHVHIEQNPIETSEAVNLTATDDKTKKLSEKIRSQAKRIIELETHKKQFQHECDSWQEKFDALQSQYSQLAKTNSTQTALISAITDRLIEAGFPFQNEDNPEHILYSLDQLILSRNKLQENLLIASSKKKQNFSEEKSKQSDNIYVKDYDSKLEEATAKLAELKRLNNELIASRLKSDERLVEAAKQNDTLHEQVESRS